MPDMINRHTESGMGGREQSRGLEEDFISPNLQEEECGNYRGIKFLGHAPRT